MAGVARARSIPLSQANLSSALLRGDSRRGLHASIVSSCSFRCLVAGCTTTGTDSTRSSLLHGRGSKDRGLRAQQRELTGVTDDSSGSTSSAKGLMFSDDGSKNIPENSAMDSVSDSTTPLAFQDGVKQSQSGSSVPIEEDNFLKTRRAEAMKNREKWSAVSDILRIFIALLDQPCRDGKMIRATGSAVIERLLEEIDKLRGNPSVDEQLLFELVRIVRLLEIDLELVAAARKDATLLERIDQARSRCQQAMQISETL